MNRRRSLRPPVSHFLSPSSEPYRLIIWIIRFLIFAHSSFLLILLFRTHSSLPAVLSSFNSLLHRRIVIPFLTCEATCWRNSLYVSPFIDRSLDIRSSFHSYVISDSIKALNTSRASLHTPRCTGGRLSANGNACRFDAAFRHFHGETNASWLLVAIDDTYLNEKNLWHLLDILEEKWDPFVDQISTGQSHHDWGTFYPHGGSGLLYSRAWVDEFFRRNFSFEAIHANNVRYTYDIATGLINLNYFEKAIWIQHPWVSVVLPEQASMEALVSKKWASLGECPDGVSLVDAKDLVQFHISPFKMETAEFVQDLEFAPVEVKVFRPTAYGVRFCRSTKGQKSVPFTVESLDKLVLDLKTMNVADAQNRLKKQGTTLPW
jgi:hypothetical protein